MLIPLLNIKAQCRKVKFWLCGIVLLRSAVSCTWVAETLRLSRAADFKQAAENYKSRSFRGLEESVEYPMEGQSGGMCMSLLRRNQPGDSSVAALPLNDRRL